jgi:hypothetical protein
MYFISLNIIFYRGPKSDSMILVNDQNKSDNGCRAMQFPQQRYISPSETPTFSGTWAAESQPVSSKTQGKTYSEFRTSIPSFWIDYIPQQSTPQSAVVLCQPDQPTRPDSPGPVWFYMGNSHT